MTDDPNQSQTFDKSSLALIKPAHDSLVYCPLTRAVIKDIIFARNLKEAINDWVCRLEEKYAKEQKEVKSEEMTFSFSPSLFKPSDEGIEKKVQNPSDKDIEKKVQIASIEQYSQFNVS